MSIGKAEGFMSLNHYTIMCIYCNIHAFEYYYAACFSAFSLQKFFSPLQLKKYIKR
jgi:hypothetical protein